MSNKEYKLQKPAAESGVQSLAFKYHREVHTRELKNFIFDAYGLSAALEIENKPHLEKNQRKK